MMKRLLRVSIALILCMTLYLCLMPSAHAASSSGTWGSLRWSLDSNGVLTISGSGAMNAFSDGESTQAWNAYKSSIKSVVINSGVTTIGSFAFSQCRSLNSVSIPSSVKGIAAGAFSGCFSLESIDIPASVTQIGLGAFVSSGLKNINVDSQNPSYSDVEGVLFDRYKTKLFIFPAGRAGSYSVPAGVEAIWSYAFAGCWAIDSILIPDGVNTIAWYAFSGCSDLKSITIPTSMTTIETQAFNGCESLSNVYYSGTQQQWQAIDINSDNTALLNANILFGRIGGTSGQLNWDLDNTGHLTISGNGIMYDFSSTSTSDWRYYKDCIISVTIQSGVTYIGEGAFYNCSQLSSAVIPYGVTSIGSGAFMSCPGLTGIVIPASVNIIGRHAFSGCSNLSNVSIQNGVNYISSNAFTSCTSLTEIYIPESVYAIKPAAFSWCSSLQNIEVSADNNYYSDIDGVLLDGSTLICCPAGRVGEYVVPNSITAIGEGAFNGCTKLTHVSLPNTITELRDAAFYGCSELLSITIPAGVTAIGQGVFYNCDNLSDIYYAGSQTQWNNISVGSDNGALQNVTIHYNSPGSAVPDFILPSSLAAIDSEAFSGGAFTCVKLPEGCTSIGWHAFADCPNLAYIYIPEGCAIDADAFSGVSGLTILGTSGGSVETWAGEHGFTFIPAD